jgi:hypothetical protein
MIITWARTTGRSKNGISHLQLDNNQKLDKSPMNKVSQPAGSSPESGLNFDTHEPQFSFLFLVFTEALLLTYPTAQRNRPPFSSLSLFDVTLFATQFAAWVASVLWTTQFQNFQALTS